MKRVVALLLLAAMLTVGLSSCSEPDLTDMGSIIPMYLASAQTDLDPTKMIYDKDFVKVSGLLFEGLTRVNSDGKIVPLLAEKWEQKYNEERGEYFLYVDIVYSRWNDGRTLTADHFVYAWKRILSPEMDSPAAALLYDIKNAREVKSGNMTIDDLGIAALDGNTLEIQFERPIDPELFLEAASSPALVPMRDDAIMGKEDTWATNTSDLSTNGAFSIKAMEADGEYRIDFSKYYRLDKKLEKGYNEFVKPYRLITDFAKHTSPSAAIEAFNDGSIYYVGSFDGATYDENKDSIKSSETLASYTYFFDCENDVLSDAKVRKALSLALSREEVASIIGMGSTAAEGFVSPAATGSTMKKRFRDEAGKVYGISADVDGAKALLNEAGVSSGEFAITYRTDRDYDEKVAEYAKGVWESLGFTVTLDGKDAEAYEKALYTGDFDVIALDYQALSTNAYSALAPFAPEYSGTVVSVDIDSTEISKHVTAYESDDYTALLNAVLELKDRAGRNAKLIELEKILADECPAIALSFYAHNYMASGDLKGLEVSPYGYTIFTNAELKDYLEKNAAYEASLPAEE